MNRILIPTQLKKVLGGVDVLEVEISSIKELIDYVSFNFPDAKDRMFKDGQFNKFILVYVNGEDIRFLNGVNTVVNDGDEISIIPALAGG